MGKRVSIFELEQGVKYAAYDGNRRLPKNYQIINGRLQNENGDGLGEMQGCSWVPVKASITFQEISREGLKGNKLFVPSKTEAISPLFMQEGIIYETDGDWEYGMESGEYTRKGGNLYTVKDSKADQLVQLSKMSLETEFTPVGNLVEEESSVMASLSESMSAKGLSADDFKRLSDMVYKKVMKRLSAAATKAKAKTSKKSAPKKAKRRKAA